LFERFTERAREVIVLAQDEARALKHNYIGTEHILLGLLRQEQGVAARVLQDFAVTLDGVRSQVARIIGPGDEHTTGQIPFTPRAKKVLELALREARAWAHNRIGPEHILLGLMRENEGVAVRILLDFDVDAPKVAEAVGRQLGEDAPAGYPESFRAPKQRYSAGPFSLRGSGPLGQARVLLWSGRLLFGISLGLGILVGWAIWGL
jgi:ATP-dependent Clp protease ATP-binding subunit ClpA